MKDNIQKIMDIGLDFFNQDGTKFDKWMATKNPLLGNVTPMEIVMNGGHAKLLSWMENQIDEGTLTTATKRELVSA